ncbi:MAG: TlpA disulfide reductase family protein [Pseudomonadota bacterium]
MNYRVLARLGAVHLLAGACLATANAATPRSLEIRIDREAEVPVIVHEARSPGPRALVLWLPTGLGSSAGDAAIAEALAGRGITVWRADVLTGRLLPPGESSLDRVPADDIARLIDHAERTTGRRVWLLASARAGLLAVRGAHAWRRQHPEGTALAGLLLLHPNLFLTPPEPGRDAEYHPLVAHARFPIYLLQPELSPWHWRLERTVEELHKGGSVIAVERVAGMRDRYYFRPDASDAERREATKLPVQLAEVIGRLSRVRLAPARAPAVAVKVDAPAPARTTRTLSRYTANPIPPVTRLTGLDGRRYDLAGYRGQVVLVNFWASWCPPCVHEMPSMQRLKEKMAGKPFTILAINMAEDEATIRRFLQEKVKVDFPILLDRDQAVLKRWKVFVFPTSYLLGADGKIAYGLAGAIEWDEPGVIAMIEKLLPAGAKDRGPEHQD